MKIPNIYNLQYYTSVSNVLFFITIIILIIRFLLKIQNSVLDSVIMGAMVNMIVVGMIGNIIVVFNRDKIINKAKGDEGQDYSCEKVSKFLSMGNFIVHTLPMIISIIMIFLLQKTDNVPNYNVVTSFLFIFIVALIWSVIPTKKGNILIKKVDEDYVNTPLVVFFFVPVLLYVILYLIYKKKINL